MGSCQFPGKQELPGCQTGNSCSSYHGLVSECDWYQMFQKRLLAHGPGQLQGSRTRNMLPYLQVLMERSLQGDWFVLTALQEVLQIPSCARWKPIWLGEDFCANMVRLCWHPKQAHLVKSLSVISQDSFAQAWPHNRDSGIRQYYRSFATVENIFLAGDISHFGKTFVLF